MSAAVILRAEVDWATFLSVASKALGFSPSRVVDRSAKTLSAGVRFRECLKEIGAEVGIPFGSSEFLQHEFVSVLLAADESDMVLVLQLIGLPHVLTDTAVRGVQLAIVSGRLDEWKQAVLTGLHTQANSYFREILCAFEQVGLTLWNEFRKRHEGTTLYLEYNKK